MIKESDPLWVSYLTVAEVKERLRVSPMTVYRLIHRSELRAIRVGRSLRVPEQALQDYLTGTAASLEEH